MHNIGRLWAGKIFGTNTGNLSLVLDNSEAGIVGNLRLMDDKFGLVQYRITGEFDGTNLKINGIPHSAAVDNEYDEINAAGSLNVAGEIRGEWTSKLGTGGTFVLLPHDVIDKKPSDILPPERLHTATRILGALRLYSADLPDLIDLMSQDFRQGRVTITYRVQGSEVTRYASDLQNDINKLGELRYLKFFIQEPDAYNINRFVSIELNAFGANIVTVQGIQSTWVVGKAENLSSYLKLREGFLSTQVNRFGLNINFFLAAGIILALPDLSIERRLIFMVTGLTIALIIFEIHKRYIPTFVMYAPSYKPSVIKRFLPQAVSWIIAATSALVATIMYGFLKGEISLSNFKF